MHMLCKKDLNLDELETVRVSRNLTTVITANGEIQTNEKATVYGHVLEFFETVQILEHTPAVPPFGKLCEEHCYYCEWASGQTPHLTKQGKKILCKRAYCRQVAQARA